MTAFVLPNLDQSTIDELRKRIPDMSEFDLPKLEKVGKDVGKTADQALDRLLGRSRMSVWPWIAGSIAIAAIIGAVAAWFTLFRRPSSVDTLVEEEVATTSATSPAPRPIRRSTVRPSARSARSRTEPRTNTRRPSASPG